MTIELWIGLAAIILGSNVLTVLISKWTDRRKNKEETDGAHIENIIRVDSFKDKQIKDLIERVNTLENNMAEERELCDKKMKEMQKEIDSLKIKSKSYEGK